MALHIQVLDQTKTRNGGTPLAPAAALDNAGAKLLTLGQQFGPIAGPCMLKLTAELDARFTITKTAGYVAPVADAAPLYAKDTDWRELPAGNFYINAVAL